MSKHVIIDGRKLGDGGIGVYIENLIDGYLECPELTEEFQVSVLISPEIGRSRGRLMEPFDRWMHVPESPQLRIPQVHSPGGGFSKICFVEAKAKKYSLGEYLFTSGNNRSLFSKHSVYHSPHFTLPFFLPIPAVVTVHDCIHLSYPRKPWHSVIAKSLLRSALLRAAQVITVSEESKEKIYSHFPALNVPIEVIPNALRYGFGETRADLGAFLQGYQLGGGYALFVGNDRPHKGFRHLLSVWRQLLDTNDDSLTSARTSVPLLAVVGEGFSSSTMEVILQLGLSDYVRFFGAVPTKTLAGFYGGASCVVLPSLEEGFGIVALEAQACRVPLICNRLACLMEISGENVWYADQDIESWVKVIIEAIKHGNKDSGIDFAPKYQRASVARKTFAVYRRALNRKFDQGEFDNEVEADGMPEIKSQRKGTQRGTAEDFQEVG